MNRPRTGAARGFFAGDLSLVAVYDRVLTDAELDQARTLQAARFAGATGRQGDGSTAAASRAR